MLEPDDIKKLRHMLGLDYKNTPWRNYYNAYKDTPAYIAMQRLVTAGLAYQSDGENFHATEKGYEVLGFTKQDDD